MWVKLDDGYYDHVKVLRAGPVAELLWVRSIAWCNRNRANGIIPTQALYRIAEFCPRLTIDGDSVSPLDLAAVLVREGMWSEHPEGWEIHDYGEYQRSAAEIEELSAKRSAAGRKGAEARWGEANDMANAIAGKQQDDWPADAPIPGPVPVDPSSVVVDEPGTCPQVPDDVWTEYARIKRPKDVRNITRYDATTIANAKTEHGRTAVRWLEDFDITPSELAQGLAMGKAAHHWNRRKVSLNDG